MPADYGPLEGLDPFDLMDVESARLDTYFSRLDAVGTPEDWAASTPLLRAAGVLPGRRVRDPRR